LNFSIFLENQKIHPIFSAAFYFLFLATDNQLIYSIEFFSFNFIIWSKGSTISTDTEFLDFQVKRIGFSSLWVK
jgi:hypothetical protein